LLANLRAEVVMQGRASATIRGAVWPHLNKIRGGHFMTYFDNGFARLYQADARHLPIPDSSVDCVVTSPPYWGLRDYGLGEWEGGSEDCQHTISMPTKWNDPKRGTNYTRPEVAHRGGDASACFLCGATRTDNGIGLEPTPEEYCANMVEVFREVWRVLKPTGTVWLNLGDSYASDTTGSGGPSVKQLSNAGSRYEMSQRLKHGLKTKDLVGIPWRVAFALQADGWYLRSDIIWSKPNPMPESVQDRPTKAHEYVFLLTKSPRYYYDADAIREPAQDWGIRDRTNGKYHNEGTGLQPHSGLANSNNAESGRNKRSVWEIATQPYPEAHFATYPEKLVEPCILAGTSERGNCAECGKPWERIVERDIAYDHVTTQRGKSKDGPYAPQTGDGIGTHDIRHGVYSLRTHKGWQPTCECDADTVPATVLDPFAGSGTTAAVAQRLGRKSIGTDLSEEYLKLASKRLGAISMPMILV